MTEIIKIPTETPSRDFWLCWQAAGRHLSAMGEKAAKTIEPELLMLPTDQDNACVWLKFELSPPFLEHLSFRLGNQLFFIRLEDMDGRLDVPGARRGLERIAEACKGLPCLMPMLKRGGQWIPAEPDWGLVALPSKNSLHRLPKNHKYGSGVLVRRNSGLPPSHPYHNVLPVNPLDMVTAEKIEMTDWELHEFAVQIVREYLPQDTLMAWNADPEVTPSLWFEGDQGPEWVIVRAVRYPAKDAELPPNIDQIAENCSPYSGRGNFAVVSAAAIEEHFDSQKTPIPLYRGHGMYVRYLGLRKLWV